MSNAPVIKSTTIDKSQVVVSWDPDTVLNVRSAMNAVINEQSNFITWVAKTLDYASLDETQQLQYRTYMENIPTVLKHLLKTLDEEDKKVGQDTNHLR